MCTVRGQEAASNIITALTFGMFLCTVPDYAKIQGSSTREVFPDPITGKYSVTFTYNVTSHWSSLAVTKDVYGQLIKVRDNELTVPKPNFFTTPLPVTVSTYECMLCT